MEKFTVYKGTTVPLMNDNIDTDQIIPKQYLKATDKTGFGKNMFFEWRYLNDGEAENPDFILNHPEYRQATILISGDNFGSGSSREHAAWAIKDYGFRAVIAGSFSDIHYNNELKNGILPIVQPLETREILAALSPDECRAPCAVLSGVSLWSGGNRFAHRAAHRPAHPRPLQRNLF